MGAVGSTAAEIAGLTSMCVASTRPCTSTAGVAAGSTFGELLTNGLSNGDVLKRGAESYFGSMTIAGLPLSCGAAIGSTEFTAAGAGAKTPIDSPAGLRGCGAHDGANSLAVRGATEAVAMSETNKLGIAVRIGACKPSTAGRSVVR